MPKTKEELSTINTAITAQEKELATNTAGLVIIQKGSPQELEALQYLPAQDRYNRITRTPWALNDIYSILGNMYSKTLSHDSAILEHIELEPIKYLYPILSRLELLRNNINTTSSAAIHKYTKGGLYTTNATRIQDNILSAETITSHNNAIAEAVKTIALDVNAIINRANDTTGNNSDTTPDNNYNNITDSLTRNTKNKRKGTPEDHNSLSSAIKSLHKYHNKTMTNILKDIDTITNSLSSIIASYYKIGTVAEIRFFMQRFENMGGMWELIVSELKALATQKYLEDSVCLVGDIDKAIAKSRSVAYNKEGEEYDIYNTGILSFIDKQAKHLREQAAILERGSVNQEQAPAIIQNITTALPSDAQELRDLDISDLSKFSMSDL